MKAIKIQNEFQTLDVVPNEWKKFPMYDLVKPAIRPDQKHCSIDDAVVDEVAKTLTFTVCDLSSEEYTEKLQKEAEQIKEELKEVVPILEFGAKKIALGKDGSRNYIESQERLYLQKYQIATGELPDVNNLLFDEAQENGVPFLDYKELIKGKWEVFCNVKCSLLAMIERARQKVLLQLETFQNHRAKEILELMKSIKIDTPLSDINDTINTIKNY